MVCPTRQGPLFSSLLGIACVALLVVAGHQTAHAQGGGWINDPENSSSADEATDDAANGGESSGPTEPTSSGSGGWIGDPENVPNDSNSAIPTRDDSEIVVDPEPARFTPTGTFRGEWTSRASVDTQQDRDNEDTFVSSNSLEAWARLRFSRQWTAVVEGRLRWQLYGQGDGDVVPDGDRWRAALETDVRDLFVSGRSGRWLFRFGQQSIVWGSSDLLRPADFIQPRDMRGGVLLGGSDARMPTPAIDAVYVAPSASLELLIVPFFVPNRMDAAGSDFAATRALTADGDTLDSAIGSLFDRSVFEWVQPALLYTERPEEVPQNASFGARLTTSPGDWDLGAGVFYGWDRTPTVAIARSAQDCLASLPDGITDAVAEPQTPQQLLDQINTLLLICPELGDEEGELFSSRFHRAGFAEIDFVTYLGAFGLRGESALQVDGTAYTDGLGSVRAPHISSTLGLSYESGTGGVIVTVEGFHQHTFVDDTVVLLQFGRDFAGIAGAMSVDLDLLSSERLSAFARRWSFQMGGLAAFTSGDLVFGGQAEYQWHPSWFAALGANFIGTIGDDASSIGALFNNNDEIFAAIGATF